MGLLLQLTVNEDIALYRDSLLFENQEVYLADTFCIIRVQFGKLWIEAVKLCRLFNYSNPWISLCKHVADENKSTAEDLLQLDDFTNGEVCFASWNLFGDLLPTTIFINKTGIWQLSRYSRKPMLKRFWDHMCKTLSKRYTLFDLQDIVSKPKKTKKKTDTALQSYKL